MYRIIPLLALLIPSIAAADQYVSPHVRSDGTYVQGYMRSSPNSTTFDNFSHSGNTNPYTGQRGYRNDYGSGSSYYTPPSYSSPSSFDNSLKQLYGND